MKRICSAALLALALMTTSISPAQAQTAQETLRQYVSDLQKTPADTAMREKIIRHVQTMKKNPPIPEQAEKFEGRAEFAAKSAKTEADFADAAREYEKALLAAPWVAAYYFNLGVMQEKAGQTQAAKQNFEFYLLAAPNALDARDVRKRIAGLEYAMEKAAKESSPAAIAEKQQNKADELLKSLNGARYVRPWQDICSGYTLSVDIHGDEVYVGETQNWKSDPGCNNESVGVYYLRFKCRVTGKKMQGDDFIFEFDNSDNNWMYKSMTISGSGNSLTLHDNSGSLIMDYTRQR